MTMLLHRRWFRVLAYLALFLLVFLFVTTVALAFRFTADDPVTYSSVEEHFKYGSTGGERASGLPYWIFQAMPQVCAKHLPGKGYASLGFIFEDGRDLPVGMSKRRHLGIDRTFLNCAVCHVSTVRTAPGRRASHRAWHAGEYLRSVRLSEIPVQLREGSEVFG